MAEFKDHFSARSADYAKYRPGYPDALFGWLATLTPTASVAWDVGTGSGQAALDLTRHFRQVIATDPAPEQIRNAASHERILYKVMPAERTDLADQSVDLITVAQALHWFDFERFYREVARVLKPGGAIVAWSYGLGTVAAEVDGLLIRYYHEIVGPYWPPERKYIDECYRTIPFPFAEIAPPALAMSERWTLDELLGYLGTWSAGKRYAQQRSTDPLDRIRDSLLQAWGPPHTPRVVTWPLYVRAGRMRAS